MQITHLNKYESLVDKHLHSSTYEQPFTLDNPPLPPQHLQEILDQIDSINLSRSYVTQTHKHQLFNQHQDLLKSNKSSAETQECDIADSRTQKSSRSKHSNKTNRSLIFAGHKFAKNKQGGKTQQIQIYYFDTPSSKTLHYDNTTKVSDLITHAIIAMPQNKQLENLKIKQRSFQHFQMRLLDNQSHFKADMSKPPIPYDREVCKLFAEKLILVQKKSQTNSVEMKGSRVVLKQIVIYLYNELGEELGCLTMNPSDSLQQIFEHIEIKELHNMRDYFLTQHKHEIDSLPRDFQIKNLQSNKIYIKTKKYIDDCQWESKPKPIKNLVINTNNKETSSSSITLPIGLSEASQYEEFSVIKVNSMGFQQERILGIDQTKLYNYDKTFREEKRQTSFFSKFFGINEETGTKKPFRLIKDILELRKQEKGLEIVFKEKAISYKVKQVQLKDKIFRKLSFLVNLCRDEHSISVKYVKH